MAKEVDDDFHARYSAHKKTYVYRLKEGNIESPFDTQFTTYTPYKLNFEEREIIELHSELGYELLKDKNLSPETLKLIKYHHQNLNRKGYPVVNSEFDCDLGLQILNAADKYSALREKRCYKDAFGKIEALQIIAEDVNQGNISQDVYTALLRAI